MRGNIRFTSAREQRLWALAGIVLVVICSTLFLGGQLVRYMVERRVLEHCTFYLFLLLVITFIISGWHSPHRKSEYWIYAGVTVVFGMAILRMDLTVAERSHMFEYGLLAIFIFETLCERKRNHRLKGSPVWIAILGAGSIGLVDELIQLFIPYRVFDPIDIGFNYFASAFGVFIRTGVRWIQLIFTGRNKHQK